MLHQSPGAVKTTTPTTGRKPQRLKHLDDSRTGRPTRADPHEGAGGATGRASQVAPDLCLGGTARVIEKNERERNE